MPTDLEAMVKVEEDKEEEEEQADEEEFDPADYENINGKTEVYMYVCMYQGFGAGAALSRGIWLDQEPSFWPGSGSTMNICLIIHEN